MLSIENELQAVEMQIQELLDKQQELIQKKTMLKGLIKKSSGDLEAGGSKETETSAEAWNKKGLDSQIQIFWHRGNLIQYGKNVFIQSFVWIMILFHFILFSWGACHLNYMG